MPPACLSPSIWQWYVPKWPHVLRIVLPAEHRAVERLRRLVVTGQHLVPAHAAGDREVGVEAGRRGVALVDRKERSLGIADHRETASLPGCPWAARRPSRRVTCTSRPPRRHRRLRRTASSGTSGWPSPPRCRPMGPGAGPEHVVGEALHGPLFDLPIKQRAVEVLRLRGVGGHQVVPDEAARPWSLCGFGHGVGSSMELL